MTFTIRVNERTVELASERTLDEVRREFKPEADVLVRNGFPAIGDEIVKDGDEVALIVRGEIPGADEMEALLVSRHTPGVHHIVRAATIGVAGLGGLGSQAAIALTRLGIGRLVLADHDIVEPSNLNRQQYFIDQIGMTKTEALTATLRRINPHVDIVSHDVELTPDKIPALFAHCSVLIEALDRGSRKEMLIATALDHLPDTIIIGASGVAGAESTHTLQVHRLNPRLYVVGDLCTEARPGVGLMAPRIGVAAHVQANVALRLLLGEECNDGAIDTINSVL